MFLFAWMHGRARTDHVQASTDPAGHSTGHPYLAVNGDTDSFALCMHGRQNNVVFRPTTGKAYDFASCYAVKVQLIYDF